MRVSWSINDRRRLGKKWESAGRIGRMKKKDYTCWGQFDLGVDCIRMIYILYIYLWRVPNCTLPYLYYVPYSPKGNSSPCTWSLYVAISPLLRYRPKYPRNLANNDYSSPKDGSSPAIAMHRISSAQQTAKNYFLGRALPQQQ